MQLGDYAVKPTCIRDENRLRNFLKQNNFKYEKYFEYNPIGREYVIVINVIHRIYFEIDKYYLSTPERISEIEFLDKINYDRHAIAKKLHDDSGELIYEGYTILDKPYGLGTTYYSNGNKYREGVFGRKGLVEGKEFYSNGQVKFEGIKNVNGGYGPNYPVRGNMYDRNGDLIFSGRFEYQKGGVGFPMMRYPRYRFEEDDAPKIKYLSLVANWEEWI